MKKIRILLIIILLLNHKFVAAQEQLFLWPSGKMPDSKGLRLTDSISNERVHRVGNPSMYAYFPSHQENRHAAVLLCPGGGYERLAYIISGTQLAKWFNTMGISAFVLNYRLPTSPDLVQREYGPLTDAQRAIKYIKAHAAQWDLDTNKIGVLGTSAGGHLAAMTGTVTKDYSSIKDSLDRYSPRPTFMMLISPVIDMGTSTHQGSRKNLLGSQPDSATVAAFSQQLQVNSNTPPAFIVHAANDKAVPPENSLLFYSALLRMNIPAALHIFTQGEHAIALRNNPGATRFWPELCEAWLTESGFLTEPGK